MYTVEFNAKKTYIPGYRRDWRRVVTTHTRVGANSPAEVSARFICLKKKYPFSIKNFIIDESIDRSVQFWVNWPQPRLTCRQITNAHRHTRTHTLPDLAYKKMCVCEQRKFRRWCGHTRTRTHTNTPTQQVQCWAKLWRAQPKTTRDTYSITMSDSYSTTWIHCLVCLQCNIIPF